MSDITIKFTTHIKPMTDSLLSIINDNRPDLECSNSERIRIVLDKESYYKVMKYVSMDYQNYHLRQDHIIISVTYEQYRLIYSIVNT